MNKTIVKLTLSMVAMGLSGALMAGVDSLRGAGIDEVSAEPEKKKVEVVQGGFERSFKEQPPMVPHEVEKYDISLRQNGCLKCHSEATYEREKAPKMGDSHYLDRDGNQLEKMSMSRYFCNQCHAPQQSAPPLVDNVFSGRK